MVDLKKPLDATALNQAMELLHFGYRAFVAEADKILVEQGLSRVHHRILYFVAREPGQRVSTLRETLGVSKQALHKPLRELEAAGLVQSAPHPQDKRSRNLTLSEEGHTLEQQVTAVQHQLIRDVLDDSAAATGWRTTMAKLAARETDRPLGTEVSSDR